MKTIQIISPFDRHGHLRQKETLLHHLVKYSARQFWGMVVMPNLLPPITKWGQAKIYYNEIWRVIREQKLPTFTLIMTAYLTDNSDPKNIKEGFENGTWKAAKLYPFGATTNSDEGVTKLENIFHVLEVMEEIGMPLLVHPETDVTRHEIMFEDRERVYVEESLVEIHKRFPKLIISVEHISTIQATQFVESCGENVVATVTPQHLLFDHNALFHGGKPPYKAGMYVENMCLPILKWPKDVECLKYAIMCGPARHKLGAGTDTAAHTQTAKHAHHSCCGCFNATHAVEHYATVFDNEGMFETENGIKIFEKFMSINNLWIYGLKPSTETIVIEKVEQEIPELVPGDLRPFKAGQTIPWKMVERER